MGYTHGEKWTLEKIKNGILEVVEANELKRMPSRSEVDKYFGDYKLSNAISKRIGWYSLAKEMGLPLKESDTLFGKKHEEKAKEILVSLGYEVRKMPQNFPYDLLVDDCLKIDVKASKLYNGERGNFYSFNLEKQYSTCDLYLLFLIDEKETTKDILVLPSKFVSTNTQIGVGEKSSKYYRFSEKWEYIEQYTSFFGSIK